MNDDIRPLNPRTRLRAGFGPPAAYLETRTSFVGLGIDSRRTIVAPIGTLPWPRRIHVFPDSLLVSADVRLRRKRFLDISTCDGPAFIEIDDPEDQTVFEIVDE